MMKDKIALVTGGRGGIGRAICARFLKEGATVYAGDVRESGSLPRHDDDGTRFIRLDVTDELTIKAAMAEIGERLDILVNAAGIEVEETIENTTLEQWNKIWGCPR